MLLSVEVWVEAKVVTGTCSLSSWRRWRCSRWCYGWGCAGRGVESGTPAVRLIQHIGWLDPVGRHGDGLAAHKELQHFLSEREDLVRATVRGLHSTACCVMKKTYVQLWMSLCTNVAEKAWCASGTGLRWAICWLAAV
jgi:hypothetical protein